LVAARSAESDSAALVLALRLLVVLVAACSAESDSAALVLALRLLVVLAFVPALAVVFVV